MKEYVIQRLTDLHGWVHTHPQSGIFVFIGIFVVAQLCMLPVSPLGMATGLFFGFWTGLFTLMIACAVGSSVNFLLVRWFARDFVRRKLQKNAKFCIIETAVATEGWRVVALLRFVPIPFGLANYCFGLTPIAYLPYIVATCIAIIPVNSLFVWIGSTFSGALDTLVKGRTHNPLEYVLLGVGIVAAFLALRMVTKAARTAVHRSTDPASRITETETQREIPL
jgi:uncharacterized membrane protein YdjX (TVP38/TMEM64 family)